MDTACTGSSRMQRTAVVMERLRIEAAMAMIFVRSECAHTIGSF